MEKDATITPLLPKAQRQQIAELLAGDADTIAEVRRWIRGASSPYRRNLAADLEDLEQQVMLDLLSLLREHRFRGESSLATYVRRMVHYQCLNRLRDGRRRQWVPVEEENLEADSPSPFERVSGRANLDLILKVLAQVPEACRELWRMIHEGFSYGDMSERLGVSSGALRIKVMRCRKKAEKLREKMESLSNKMGSKVTE